MRDLPAHGEHPLSLFDSSFIILEFRPFTVQTTSLRCFFRTSAQFDTVLNLANVAADSADHQPCYCTSSWARRGLSRGKRYTVTATQSYRGTPPQVQTQVGIKESARVRDNACMCIRVSDTL